MPNAGAHLLPEAGATQERTLEAVRCSALFGVARPASRTVVSPACYPHRPWEPGLLVPQRRQPAQDGDAASYQAAWTSRGRRSGDPTVLSLRRLGRLGPGVSGTGCGI
jgi:hypothetical protein